MKHGLQHHLHFHHHLHQNLFGFISDIFQPIIQVVNNTLSNVTSSISDVFVGVDTYNSTDPDAILICKDKMFQLQIEIFTDGTPDRTSWELLYENDTVIHSVGQDTYSECDTSYKHNYWLDPTQAALSICGIHSHSKDLIISQWETLF